MYQQVAREWYCSMYSHSYCKECASIHVLTSGATPLISSIKEEAAVNSEAVRVLIPHVATVMSSLERVFPNDQASEVREGH